MSKPGSEHIVERGRGRTSPAGTATFVGLRGLDPLLQHAVLSPSINLARPLITTFGGSTIASAPAAITGLSLLDNNLALSPYRLALLGMSVGSALKHIFWISYINGDDFTPKPAAIVSAFNFALDSINSILFMAAGTSPATARGEGPYSDGFPGGPLIVGGSLFTAGILIETICEIQRKLFKQSEEGKGKPYTKGLFGIVRHVNYTGYSMWRAGYAMAAGGWIWGTVVGAFLLFDFSNRAIPGLDAYCHQRYADMWVDYKANVPYKIIPYVY